MSSLWDAVFIQGLDRTGPLMLNPSGTPYGKSENKLEHSKIFLDNDQKVLLENAAHTHGTEAVIQETIIKGKMIMTLPTRKASYKQEIGFTDADPSRRCAQLFQCDQICEPVLGAPTIPLDRTRLFQRTDNSVTPAVRIFSRITVPIPPNILCP
jgi:hypothetical protein